MSGPCSSRPRSCSTGYLVFGPEDLVDARVGRYVDCRSPAWLLVRASVTAKGTAVTCAVGAEPAPEGDGAAAIAGEPRRYPRER
jgi:hypothetical protein